jgi:hypothetical protein
VDVTFDTLDSVIHDLDAKVGEIALTRLCEPGEIRQVNFLVRVPPIGKVYWTNGAMITAQEISKASIAGVGEADAF